MMIWIPQQSTVFQKLCVKHTFGEPFLIEEVLRGSDFSINASHFQDFFSQAHRIVSEFRLKLKVLHMSHHESLEANEILPKAQRCLQTSC